MEIGPIFHNKYEKDFPRWNMVNDLVVYRERIYSESILQELPSERSRLSKCFGLDNNNPPICKVLFAQNGTGQYPVWITQKPRKTDLKELKSKTFPDPPTSLRLRLGNRSVFILDPRLIVLRLSVPLKVSDPFCTSCKKSKHLYNSWFPFSWPRDL